MRISFVGAAARLPDGKLARRIASIAATLDSIIHDHDDRAVSRRIAVVAFTVRIFGAAIAYLSQVLLARWMGEFQYGVFVVVWVWAIVLGSVACLGFDTAIMRFVPEYTARGEARLLRGVLLGSRLQSFAAATGLAVFGALGLYFFGDALSSYYVIPLYLGAITLPMFAVTGVNDGVARAFSWADLGLWPTFVIRPILVIVFMGLAVFNGADADAVTAMGAVIAATYLTATGQYLLLSRRLRGAVPEGPRDFLPLSWVAVALPIFVVEGFYSLLTNVDIIMVGRYMQPDQVAIYFAATKTLALVHFVYFSVRAGSAHRFSQYYASGDHARLAAFVRDTLHWIFWPSLAMVLVLFAVGKPLLLLFGPNFGSGYPLLYILSVGLLFRAAIGPAESLLIMAGQQGGCAAVYTATFLVNIGLNFSLIPPFGLAGAATATAIALIFESFALYWLTDRRLGVRCSIFAALRLPRPSPVEAG